MWNALGWASVGWLWVGGSLLCGGEAMALENVVGERVVQHDGTHLCDAAHGQLPQVPVAPAGMDAFADRAALVERLAGFARHPLAPGQHALMIATPRQIRIGAVLGLGGWTIDGDPLAMRPLAVLGRGEAAVGKVASRKMAGPHAQLLQHRPQEATIGTGIGDLDRDHDLLAGRARHLHVIGRTEAAVGHLHDPRLGVRGGGARLLRRLAVAALVFALLALLLDLAERLLRRLEALAALARRPFFCRLNALVAGIRLRVDLALEVLHYRLRRRQMPIERRL